MVEVDGSGLVKQDQEVQDTWTELEAVSGALDHVRNAKGVLDTFGKLTQKHLKLLETPIKKLEEREKELYREMDRIRAERGLRPQGGPPRPPRPA